MPDRAAAGAAEPLGIERTWAIESATGLGRLLAQQLVAADENVVDVPPTLAVRVRLLNSTKAAKNDPNDALATAVAGLRHCGLRAVATDQQTAVVRMTGSPAMQHAEAGQRVRPNGRSPTSNDSSLVDRPSYPILRSRSLPAWITGDADLEEVEFNIHLLT